MAPTPYMMHSECSEEPISRTYQYRKVMKPMLERKRRARINRCLDELKDLMVTALQNGGENVSKLEKADILELTVRHLHNLKQQHQLIIPQKPATYADKFRDGFTQCAQEVTQFISIEKPGVVDQLTGRKLMQHLGACVNQLDYFPQNLQPLQRPQNMTPPVSPSVEVTRQVREVNQPKDEPMWRPW